MPAHATDGTLECTPADGAGSLMGADNDGSLYTSDPLHRGADPGYPKAPRHFLSNVWEVTQRLLVNLSFHRDFERADHRRL